MAISNPGGFVEGVTIKNLLVVAPKPRNPVLADAFKRIGLAERTGRGVDKIFAGMIRYGRPPPDYAQSDASSVVVRLAHTTADLPFFRMIVEEEGRTGAPLPVDTLLALGRLRDARRASLAEIAEAIQRDESSARRVVEQLVESGLVEAHGNTRARTYTLSAKAYRELGAKAAYVRQAGFDALQQEQMVLTFARKHGEIRRADVIELCRVPERTATRLLTRLVAEGHLQRDGARKAAVYAPTVVADRPKKPGRGRS